MALPSQLIVAITICVSLLFSARAAAFSGNFEVSNVWVESPSEADSSSTANSFCTFDFIDQDTPDCPPVHCCLEWPAGQEPPSSPIEGTCSDNNVTVCVPDGMYSSAGNLTITLGHSYEDNSIGQAPFNILTKFGDMCLEYGATPDYECDMGSACCESCAGAIFVVVVTSAVA